jgi:RNA polymerase sigma factor (sigma-70 family)
LGHLDQGRPAFLDNLDKDRECAFREFYAFAWTLLSVSPPAVFRSFPAEEREGLVADILFHCVDQDFRVLRSYRGGSFAGWLQTVARNRVLDEIRRRARRREVPLPEDEAEETPRGEIRSTEPLQDERKEWSDFLESVRDCIGRMSKKCRILLWASAEGLRPREIQRLLGAGSGSNKAVSDDLRHCRDRLKRLLAEEGLDWAEGDSVAFGGRTE